MYGIRIAPLWFPPSVEKQTGEMSGGEAVRLSLAAPLNKSVFVVCRSALSFHMGCDTKKDSRYTAKCTEMVSHMTHVSGGTEVSQWFHDKLVQSFQSRRTSCIELFYLLMYSFFISCFFWLALKVFIYYSCLGECRSAVVP